MTTTTFNRLNLQKNDAQIKEVIGDSPLVLNEDFYVSYGTRSCEHKYVPPVEQTALPNLGPGPTGDNRFYSFSFKTENFVWLPEMFLCSNSFLTSSTGDYGLYVVNQTDLVQPPYTRAQQFHKIKIFVNNFELKNNTEQYDIIDAFINPLDKIDLKNTLRAGLPYQKCVQDGFNQNTNIIQKFEDNFFDCSIMSSFLSPSTNPNPEPFRVRIPLWMYSNFFAQKRYLPPNTKIEFRCNYQATIAMYIFGVTSGSTFAPGYSYSVNVPLGPQRAMSISGMSNILIEYNSYKFSNLKTELFFNEWKKKFLLYRYFHIEQKYFSNLCDGTTTSFVQRLHIQETNDAFLALAVMNLYKEQNGQLPIFNLLNRINNSQNFLSAEPSFNFSTNQMMLKPFRLQKIKVRMENYSEPLLDFTTNQTYLEVHQYLAELTKDFFRNSPNQINISEYFDIDGKRGALLIIPLTFEKKLSSNIGSIPILNTNLIVEYTITDFLNQPLLVGYEIRWFGVSSRELQFFNNSIVQENKSPYHFDVNGKTTIIGNV